MTQAQRNFIVQWATLTAGIGCLLAAMLVVLISPGCQQVPMSDRKRLMLITTPTAENEIGLTAYKEVLEKEPATKNERAIEVVRRIGKRIADVANQPDFQWEFNVIESETQNAFCLPGGKVAVYTGILPVCQNEAGLAVVMSHEVAHAIARHGGERMNQQMITNGVKTGGTYLLNKNKVSEQKQQFFMAAYGQAAQYGYILPYSRKHELEADAIGIKLLAKAGYDPSEAPVFWERFSTQKAGEAPAEWMSTHPADATRAAALRELLPAAMKEYEAAPEKIGLGEALMKDGQ